MHNAEGIGIAMLWMCGVALAICCWFWVHYKIMKRMDPETGLDEIACASGLTAIAVLAIIALVAL